MRIHIVGVARNPSTPNIAVDPYARASYWLTTMLYRKGIEVYYYGHKSSTVECTKKFDIVDNNFHKNYFTTDFAGSPFTDSIEAQNTFTQNVIEQLTSQIKSGDIVACMWSEQVSKLKELQQYGVKVVDAHVGHLSYYGADYNIFTSTANQHYIYGKYDLNECRWYDVVLPPICDSVNEFEYNEVKDGSILYLARIIESKGIHIFLDLAKYFPNKKFIIAGQGSIDSFNLPSNVEYVGYAYLEDRKKLLSKASAVISATYYIEPFGLTTIEANLSGTPVITTPWGGYTDNVIEGITGFKCSDFSDFTNAINNLDKINSKNCRKFGEQFTVEALIDKYIAYFKRLTKSNWYGN